MPFRQFGFTHSGESAFTVEDCEKLFTSVGTQQKRAYRLEALYSHAGKDGTVSTHFMVWPPMAFADVKKTLTHAFGLDELKLVTMSKEAGLPACPTQGSKRTRVTLRSQIHQALKGHAIFLRHTIQLGLYREENALYDARTNWDSTDDDFEDHEQADEP